ncbi:MAG: fructosamine kinase family protein [Saprospiraceae bacterium]
MLPKTLRLHLEYDAGYHIRKATPVAGGDVNRAYRVECDSGRFLLLKYNNSPEAADMFRTEALGLALLGASRVIRVPRVVYRGMDRENRAYLLLEYVEKGHRTPLFWQQFGQSLTNLHGNTSDRFGFAHDNYIGRLPQSNIRHYRWSHFYAQERLIPQMEMAIQRNRLTSADARLLDLLCNRLDSICPEEPPALIHGDLWNGNVLCDPYGQTVLIDPSASFSHREMDLAMAQLFGGFHASFFDSYHNAWPLEPGLSERVSVYQLYYILVHVNQFGGSYIQDARKILQKYS